MMNRRKISEDGSPCLYGRGQVASSQICDLYNQAGIELCWDVLEFDGIETYDYEVTLPQSIVSMVFDV